MRASHARARHPISCHSELLSFSPFALSLVRSLICCRSFCSLLSIPATQSLLVDCAAIAWLNDLSQWTAKNEGGTKTIPAFGSSSRIRPSKLAEIPSLRAAGVSLHLFLCAAVGAIIKKQTSRPFNQEFRICYQKLIPSSVHPMASG